MIKYRYYEDDKCFVSRFALNGYEDLAKDTFVGTMYHGDYWNGFACPFFTVEEGLRLVARMNEDTEANGEFGYDPLKDCFTYRDSTYDEDEESTQWKAEEHNGKKLYPIGSCFCWFEVKEEVGKAEVQRISSTSPEEVKQTEDLPEDLPEFGVYFILKVGYFQNVAAENMEAAIKKVETGEALPKGLTSAMKEAEWNSGLSWTFTDIEVEKLHKIR